MLRNFWNDESGFLVSAELILIATIMVIGLIVGMVEIQYAVVGELNDVSEAIGSMVQSFSTTGFTSIKSAPGNGGIKAQTFGSNFFDTVDQCDGNQCQIGCDAAGAETPKA